MSALEEAETAAVSWDKAEADEAGGVPEGGSGLPEAAAGAELVVLEGSPEGVLRPHRGPLQNRTSPVSRNCRWLLSRGRQSDVRGR